MQQLPKIQKKDKVHTTQIPVGGIVIGADFLVIAGPCAVESREQIMQAAASVKAAGSNMLRGGAYKPRSSPYSFQGLGQEGLQYLKEAGQAAGLPVITEVLDPRDVGLVSEYADVLQIGSRNMQNFPLLVEVGQTQKPVMLKRGLCATLEEWLASAEYIMKEGNPNVFLCERGIRSFETYTRNTLDLSAVPVLHNLTHLPVVVDPSHATGKANLVAPMAYAAAASGADAIMVEVHNNPSCALCDGAQSLTPPQFDELSRKVRRIREAIV